MFCTSLRRRPSFASALPTLASSLKLRESQLNTHDAEIPLGAGIDRNTGMTRPAHQLRALFLSTTSVSHSIMETTFERIRHFESLTGGQDLVVILLLNPSKASTFVSAREMAQDSEDDHAGRAGIRAYAKLQAEMLNHSEPPHIPILPIYKLGDLSHTLEKHVTSLKNKLPKQHMPLTPTTPFQLLRQCTANPPMDDQTAYNLTDVFSNLKDMAAACMSVESTPDSSAPCAGAALIQTSQMEDFTPDMSTQRSNSSALYKLNKFRDLAGQQECKNVVDYWKEEWLVN